MINHVQRGRLRVNESHVIGFHELDGGYEAQRETEVLHLIFETRCHGSGLVSQVYTVTKVNIRNGLKIFDKISPHFVLFIKKKGHFCV